MSPPTKPPLYKAGDRIVMRDQPGTIVRHLSERPASADHMYRVQLDDGGSAVAHESYLKPLT
jgi:hypothetical protein